MAGTSRGLLGGGTMWSGDNAGRWVMEWYNQPWDANFHIGLRCAVPPVMYIRHKKMNSFFLKM